MVYKFAFYKFFQMLLMASQKVNVKNVKKVKVVIYYRKISS